MKNNSILIFLVLMFSTLMRPQDNSMVVDTAKVEKEHKLELKVDLVSRYLWRGQCWGGDYVAVQPSIEYAITPQLTLGCWATTNFKRDYFYPDGATAYKGYQEIDFYATYQITNFLQFQLWDYYWPSVSTVEGVNNQFLNYSSDGVKTVDATLYFDFSEGYKYPFNATISTLVAGNDFRYDSADNPIQNYTTYLEIGYSIYPFDQLNSPVFKNIEIAPSVGAVLNNQAAYYTYADYNKVSFVNVGFKATKEINWNNGFSMPLFINFIHNGATRNTETFGKNFFVVGVSFTY